MGGEDKIRVAVNTADIVHPFELASFALGTDARSLSSRSYHTQNTLIRCSTISTRYRACPPMLTPSATFGTQASSQVLQATSTLRSRGALLMAILGHPLAVQRPLPARCPSQPARCLATSMAQRQTTWDHCRPRPVAARRWQRPLLILH